MSDQVQQPVDPNENPYGYLGIAKNPDGSITRLFQPPSTPASSDPSNPFHLSKDLDINQSKGTWARIFVPRKAFDDDDSSPKQKLPLIIYFHAGGFVACSVNTAMFDALYTPIVTEIPAVVVSVEYRLGPEHRLPAAYEDCFEALHWIIKNSNDEWLEKHADFSKAFLMGSSAGGNIVYHVGLQVAACVDDLLPLQIKGLIMHQPFFGGIERTESELRLANDRFVPLSLTDLMWDLSLPIGVDRDHEYCNPMAKIKPDQFDQVKSLGWKILVTGFDGDLMIDRQIELWKKLEEKGVSVTGKFDEGGAHAYELGDPTKAKELAIVIKDLVESTTTS
ncbi:carboxylesterase 1-like [Coffea eugenioides]|uniref:Carboxylesterase 1-like n=1 Tax=Coffea arabica TaxID=13443 RepID=A0ABM4VDX8_COFAR|nr:carboxylesterase 1-like [Coffea eugenioides]